MSVKKAFLSSFLVFILLNFMFTIIYFSIQGQLSYFTNSITEKPFRFLFYLFQPIFVYPWDVLNAFFLFSDRATIAMLLGFISAPLIASIGSGNSGETELESLGGWCLTMLTCSITWMILISYDSIFRYYIDTAIPLESAILTLILNGFFLSIFYGISAVLVSFMKNKISDLD